MPRVDIRRVAAAALASAESLLREWLPGGERQGGEYKALNPTRSDGRLGSFSVNINSGAWGDFATGDKGGDLVSLYAYLENIGQLDAAKALAEQLRIDTNDAAPAAAKPAAKRSDWTPILPVPDGAPSPPIAHFKRGVAHMFWDYRDAAGKLLARIMRFQTSDGGKEIVPFTYCHDSVSGRTEWHAMQLPEPRALYGLEKLLPDGPVLIVEGEKCADAARSAIPSTWSVVTWPGGGKAVAKADWKTLHGRKVVIWPDCDAQIGKDGKALDEESQPGILAAEQVAARLLLGKCEVRIVKIPAPGAKPPGWDIADALAEGWTSAQVREFMVANLRPARVESKGLPPTSDDDSWRRRLARNEKGQERSNVANAYEYLTNRSEWRDVLAFDEFAARPVKRQPPPYERGVAGDWDENDDRFTMLWLVQRAGLDMMSSMAAAEAAEMAARIAPFDPVRDYLDGLVWDKTPRLHCWLSDFMGVPQDDYSSLIGRLWFIGMVKRVYEPGCKFDYMPILEGGQGRGKSTALEILAHPWFGNTDFVMGDKDSMAVMQGKLLYEVAELDSFNKADTTRVKSFVSRQVDEFRPAYGRRIVRMPRRVVLVGTTNQHEYFKDATGNRRFWPLQCREQIEFDALRSVRDQLWAEAVVLFRSGERCFPSRDQQELLISPHQASREIADTWEDGVWKFLQKPDDFGKLPDTISTFEILVHGLHIEIAKVSKDMTTRVGIIMRKLNWSKLERKGQHPRYVYKRPEKSANDTGDAPAEAEYVPI